MDIVKIKNLSISIGDKEIIENLNLNIKQGMIHVIMGPNGSGKSTLANALAGSPVFYIKNGDIIFNNENINELSPDERAKKGLFIAFQYPKEIPGVFVSTFLRASYLSVMKARNSEFRAPSVIKFKQLVKEKMDLLEIDDVFLDRYLNKGFSGGEKKKLEILQMLLLEPSFVILDEIDSGLDIDALKIVSRGVNFLNKQKNTTFLVITHYQRILKYIIPNTIHVMVKGVIRESGGKSFAKILEKDGYKKYLSQ